MTSKFQVTFKNRMVEKYPVAKRLMETLSGKERAATILAVLEAFAMRENMQGTEPKALFHHAEELLLGYDPGKLVGQSEMELGTTNTQQHADFLGMVEEAVNSYDEGGR